MAELNQVMFIGRLTRDPETRYVNESLLAQFGFAINRSWRDRSGEKKSDVCFIDVVAWGKTAEVVQKYLKKGDPVYVQGRLQLDTWEKDGQKHSRHKVTAENIQFLKSKAESEGDGGWTGGGGGGETPPARPRSDAKPASKPAPHSAEIDDALPEEEVPF